MGFLGLMLIPILWSKNNSVIQYTGKYYLRISENIYTDIYDDRPYNSKVKFFSAAHLKTTSVDQSAAQATQIYII